MASLGSLRNAIVNRDGFPSISSWKKLPTRVESYLANQLPGRNSLVGWNARLRTGCLGTSPTPRVWIGSNGWLFFNHGANLDADFDPATAADNWNTLMRNRHDWCRQHGIQFLAVAAPDKQSVYPEFLPARIRHRSREDLLDHTLALWSVEPAVPVVDLRADLLQGKSIAPVYLKNDSHWSPYGCWRGALAAIDALSARWRTMQPPSPDEFVLEYCTIHVADTWRLLGLEGEPPAETCLEPKLRERQARICAERMDTGDADGLRHLRPVVWERSDGAGPRVVLVGDSFADERFQEVLAQCCSRLVFVPTYQMPTDLIERERPDIVIVQFVERALACERPWAPRR